MYLYPYPYLYLYLYLYPLSFGVCVKAFFAFSARLPANHVLSAPSQTGVLILRRNQAKICGESVAR